MKKALALFVVLAVLLTGSAALAEKEPLLLEESSIADSQKDVPLDAGIVLNFSNNVVNASVRENNAACFKLVSGGKETAIDVVMADDQVQPEGKRTITIQPREPLQKGRQYKLTISKELTAKNGNSLGEDITITFTTEGYVAYGWYAALGAAVILIIAVIMIARAKNAKSKS